MCVRECRSIGTIDAVDRPDDFLRPELQTEEEESQHVGKRVVDGTVKVLASVQ